MNANKEFTRVAHDTLSSFVAREPERIGPFQWALITEVPTESPDEVAFSQYSSFDDIKVEE